MKKLLLAFILYQSSLTIGTAQNLDSLYTVWQDKTQTDSARVEAYVNYIDKGFIYSYPDSALVLAEDLHRFAKDHNFLKADAEGYRMQGSANMLLGNFTLALEFQEKSLKVAQELGDKKLIVSALGNMGTVYINQGNYPRAIENYEKCLKLAEEIGDKIRVAKLLGNFGVLYNYLGNNSKALEYQEKCLKVAEEIGEKNQISGCLASIGTIYAGQGNYPRALEYLEKSLITSEEIGDKMRTANILGNIGAIYILQGNYSRALEYTEKSLKIQEEIGDKSGMAGSLGNMGELYSLQGEYSLALEYLDKSLKLAEEIGSKRQISSVLKVIGDINEKQGKHSLALNYCQRSLAMAEEIGELEKEKAACQCLYDTYKAMGKGNEALVYLEKMRIVEDSLHAQETAKKLEQMEFAKIMLQDSIAKAEEARLVQEAHEDEMRQEEKTRNIGFGIGGLVLLLAIGLYSRLRYVRKSKAVLQVEKDRSENLLLNILPEEIAQELKEKGKADARDFEMVSILFTDFKGFTEQSAKLSAAELVHEINHCFEAFDGIIEKYNVEKIKTIGDAYMAAGGLPVPTDDSVKNTVLAALEMQAFISKRKAANDADDKPAFEMRVGIHTGPVVAGIVGVKKFQYDIWGDTVNTASRMESAGEVGKVNISQATYELLKTDQDFAFEPRGKIEAKGKGTLEMYFVSLKNKG